MRLISDIHDYYDSIFRTSVQDKRDTFVRNRTVIHNKTHSFRSTTCSSTKHSYTLTTGIIGFCGRIYPFIRVWASNLDMDIPSSNCCYYTYEDFIKHNSDIRNGLTKIVNNHWGILNSLKGIKAWLERGEEQIWSWGKHTSNVLNNPIYLAYFRKHNVAYFSVEDENNNQKITLYPVLKDFQFYKVYDVNTTFQMIEIYLHNDLAPRDEVNIPISDILKAETHGFDRFSFRKDPTSKKRRK